MTQAVLETQRLRLRPLQPSDAGLIRLYTEDERVARMTSSIPHPVPPGATEAFVSRVLEGKGDETVWAIDHKASIADGLIGTIGLTDAGEIGYWLGAPFWATGFGTEALEAVVSYAKSADVTRLEACVFQDNPASAKVLTKVGFAYTGECSGHSVARDATVPTWTYALETGTWPGQH